MTGNSKAIKQIFSLMEKATTNAITVTINGETGTGKEVVAKAIHYNSARKNKPFVAITIPHELIESELFGHEKGSFTGATDRRIGKFEEAHNGTLFLDEIGEMDLNMQAKLLRVLQEKEITRVGGNKKTKVDCRIIVATHRNLQEEVKKGKFREDLFYRIFGLQIYLPPLRDRDKDAILLAKHFLNAFAKDNNTPVVLLSNEAQLKLLSYHYPGNVRELKSMIELAAVMTNTNTIETDDIIFSSSDTFTELTEKELTLKEYTDKLLRLYLTKYDNNIKIVAQKLDIGVSTIYRLLKEHDIDA
jgi:two-component system response regulator AtoC